MRGKSFKYKIFALFATLALALTFFSLYFIYHKYTEAQHASTRALSARIAKSISRLVHAVQIERGLSSGYLVQESSGPSRERLRRQYRMTNYALEEFSGYSTLKTTAKKGLVAILSTYNGPRQKRLHKMLPRLKNMRKTVSDGNATFDDVMQYYSAINTELLDIYYGLSWLTSSQYYEGIDLHRMERIKEYAGKERAYIFNQLLDKQYSLRMISSIRELIAAQETQTPILLSNMPEASLSRYYDTVTHDHLSKVRKFRDRFFRYTLTEKDALKWFGVSTDRIDDLGSFALETTDRYLSYMLSKKEKAQSSLYIVIVMGALAFFAFLVLVYYLNRLLERDELLFEDLRVASFAFDSHEAMAVTDMDGSILKINNAFSRITGYSEDEAIGQNPSILKSGRHSDAYYAEMWRKLISEGHWRGEIWNKRKNGEVYPEQLSITAIKNEEEQVTHYISQFLDISELKKAEAEALYQAGHDLLTGLPNRKSMLEKLKDEHARAKRHHYYNAYLFIDLDDFKKVNDVYGHARGDQLLVEIAHRLRQDLRQEDYVARISGDEFCVMLLEIGESEEQAISAARKASSKLIHTLDRPYLFGRIEVNIGVSFGIRLFPDNNIGVEDIINHADTAMYTAKEKGKNRYVFYDHKVEQRILEIAQMENDLLRGIEADELVFYYQPKVEVKTGAIRGAELLVRWNHPERGLLYPDAFLKALKNIAMMPKLSELALHAACQFLIQNSENFLGTLSINVTVDELRTLYFVEMTKQIINDYDVDPSRIEIEILENDLIEDFDAVVSQMNALKTFGVQFSIDDFGKGYSSINYLRLLPVDTIKIDRDFVIKLDDPRTREVVRIIIDFSKAFGLKTVLEGIDDTYQLDLAGKFGANMYQGYLFSKAIEEDAFVELLRENQSKK